MIPPATRFAGARPRNGPLFLRPGHAYVYIAYGTSMMLNVSSEPEGIGSGVLLRALEPVDGLELMLARRTGAAIRDVARGPGRLAMALSIDLSLNGLDLCEPGDLFLADDGTAPEIGISTRIGLTKAADLPLRFYARGSAMAQRPTAFESRARGVTVHPKVSDVTNRTPIMPRRFFASSRVVQPADTGRPMPRHASSISVTSKPRRTASSADQATQKSVARPAR